MSIGERLKQERERRGLTQTEFGKIAGAANRTVIDWEKGVSTPTLRQAEPLVAAGIDVTYVLTGMRTVMTASESLPPGSKMVVITEDEADLLDGYKDLTEEARRALRNTKEAFVHSTRQVGRKRANSK